MHGLRNLTLAVLLVLGAMFGAARAEDSTLPRVERELWNVTRATSADVLTVSLTQPSGGSAVVTYRVSVFIDASSSDSILYARYTRTSNRTSIQDVAGNVDQAANAALNSATALTAGSFYTFDIPATQGVSVNFRVGTQTIFRWFLVQRIQEGQ
jgi:hypothetical protein